MNEGIKEGTPMMCLATFISLHDKNRTNLDKRSQTAHGYSAFNLQTNQMELWMKKIILVVAALFFASLSFADSIQPNLKNHFKANFKIDSIHTTDGKNYQVSVSGEAGQYGRAYLSYVFTDKQGLGDRGEFTGHAWRQNGEEVVTATLQGVYVKSGAVFKLYSFDTASSGDFNYGRGTLDLVGKTLTFEAANLVIE